MQPADNHAAPETTRRGQPRSAGDNTPRTTDNNYAPPCTCRAAHFSCIEGETTSSGRNQSEMTGADRESGKDKTGREKPNNPGQPEQRLTQQEKRPRKTGKTPRTAERAKLFFAETKQMRPSSAGPPVDKTQMPPANGKEIQRPSYQTRCTAAGPIDAQPTVRPTVEPDTRHGGIGTQLTATVPFRFQSRPLFRTPCSGPRTARTQA